MTATVDAMTELQRPARAERPLTATRPFLWSVRREVWEHRSIYVAPAAVAAVVILALAAAAMMAGEGLAQFLSLDPARQATALATGYGGAAVPVTMTSILVGIFYCLGALYNERRDRSILFWKSMPVSDLTTVLAKASIPLIVLPLVTVAIIVVLRLAILLLAAATLMFNGLSPAVLWIHFPLAQLTVVPLYGQAVESLWYAPVFAYLLLVSAWARRAPFLWAVLPPLGLCLFERIAFHTSYLSSLIAFRLTGGDSQAFVAGSNEMKGVISQVAQFDPTKFLTSPGLWEGLGFAAAALAGAVWLRRRREPI